MSTIKNVNAQCTSSCNALTGDLEQLVDVGKEM